MPYCKIALTAPKPKPEIHPKKINSLGDHIRRARIEKGLLQKQVGELIGVNKTTITNWEGQHSYPALIFIPAIIRFLGYNPLPKSENLAHRLARYRSTHGVTQKTFARQLRIDPATFARWERGERTPTGLYRKLVDRLLADDEPERI